MPISGHRNGFHFRRLDVIKRQGQRDIGLCVPHIPSPLALLCNGQDSNRTPGKPALYWYAARGGLTGMAVQLSEMEWISHSWPLNRSDPTVRRYLPQRHCSQGPLQSPQRTFYSQDFYSMTHQSKKKRTEDDSLPTDVGAKPVQLQRRRVWRACESCRFVPHPLTLGLQHVS